MATSRLMISTPGKVTGFALRVVLERCLCVSVNAQSIMPTPHLLLQLVSEADVFVCYSTLVFLAFCRELSGTLWEAGDAFLPLWPVVLPRSREGPTASDPLDSLQLWHPLI